MPSSVLIIDDSKLFRDKITEALQNAALFDDYRTAKDGLEGFKSLSVSRADLVICDLEMPQMDGLRFLQMVSSRPELQDIPILLLTGSQDRAAKLKSLEHGASDYLTKPVDIAELVARVRIHLKMKKLQDELKAANEHFRRLSTTDPLTTLYNRRFLTETLENEIQRAARLQSHMSLLMFDIDHFKKINDVYGHQVGDKVLVAVADALKEGLRTYDFAARYGGEEFVLVLPGTSLSGGQIVAERLRESVQSLKFQFPMDTLNVTVSAGIATFPTEHIFNVDTLIRFADEALYRAKENGRNRVELMADKLDVPEEDSPA